MEATWATDPWPWIAWLVLIGSTISAAVAFVVILVLTEPRQHG